MNCLPYGTWRSTSREPTLRAFGHTFFHQHGALCVWLVHAKRSIEHLGTDVGKFLSTSVKWLEIPVEQAAALVEPVIDAYLAGLTEAGWTGNDEQVKLTYLTYLGMEEATSTISLAGFAVDHPDSHDTFADFFRCPAEARWAAVLRFFVTCQQQALQLACRL